jgi:hypothetical protein
MVEIVVNNDKTSPPALPGVVLPFVKKGKTAPKKAPAKKKTPKRQAQETAARIGAAADKMHAYCEQLTVEDLKELHRRLAPFADLLAILESDFVLADGAPQ